MKSFWIVICVILVGCDPSNGETKVSENIEKSIPNTTTKVEPAESQKVEKKAEPKQERFASDIILSRRFENENLSAFDILGTVDSGISWSDKKGRNLLIFSKVEKKAEVTFHIRHYLENASGKEKRIDLKEYLYCDRKDFGIDVDKTRFSVQDLDQDGIGEPTFGYTVKCDDDVANVFKFFLLEDGEKYKLTGSIKKKKTLGSYEANKNLKSQPLFMKYLSKNWAPK